MAEPFVGEIRPFSFPFAPRGWHSCDGSLLQISQNQALFSILGTTYGGDGVRTFALPDLRGRSPVKFQPSGGIALGESGGEMVHALKVQEMPMHTHMVGASSGDATSKQAANNLWANAGSTLTYASSANTAMSAHAISSVGGGQPHDNMQPYIVINFCIALAGIFPTRS